MKILFIIALCLFIAFAFIKYKCTSMSKFIDYMDKRIMRLEMLKRDLEELSPKACKVMYITAYVVTLLVNLAIVYVSLLGISTL